MDKMISKLQSRIAQRKKLIHFQWEQYLKNEKCFMNKTTAEIYGQDQKLDKQLLQQLYFDRNIQQYILTKEDCK